MLSKRCFRYIRSAIHGSSGERPRMELGVGTVGVQRDTEAAADGESWRECGLRRKGSQDSGLRSRDTSGTDGGKEASKGGSKGWSSLRGGLSEVQQAVDGESGACTTAQSLGR